MGSLDVLLDTNVLIEIWRGDTHLIREVSLLNCAVDTTVYLEFLQGANKNQLVQSETFLENFELIPFSSSITFLAIDLIRRYSHMKGLRMADALIAAAATENNLPLFTLNTKHFEFVEGMKLI